MPSLGRFLRRLVSRLSILLVVAGLADRVRRAWSRHNAAASLRRQAGRTVLPSIYDRHPEAGRAPRRRVGLRSVAIDDIVGTMRHPSQNTADFLPLPRLRGENWRARWQRITRAVDRLVTLPPVDLMQVADEYYIADGHNRVAAARAAGALEIDADVTQLLIPGVARPGQGTVDTGALIGGEQVRMAGQGRHTRTVEQRGAEEQVWRRDLVRDDDGGEPS